MFKSWHGPAVPLAILVCLRVFRTRVGRVGEVTRRPGLQDRPEEVIRSGDKYLDANPRGDRD